MTEININKIEPVDFDLTESPLFSNQANQANQVKRNKPPVLLWISLAGLFVVALFVTFVLPAVVTEYELPLERRVDTAEILPAQTTAAGVAISPFEEAQRLLQRKEAQDVLAELLTRQAELTPLKVDTWGQLAYEEALSQASIGDEYYRTQDFALARDTYAKGRDSLSQIIASIPMVVTQALIDAEKGMQESDAELALEKFGLVMLLAPDNAEAQIGIQRANTLDEVQALLEQADKFSEDGQLSEARSHYQQAANLDSYNEYAGRRVLEVASLITENEFSRIMSSGYALLENGEPQQAIAYFQQAANIGVNREQALAAITQTENEIANAEITQLQIAVSQTEKGEQWQAAVDEYDKVLAIDSNLLFAINGRDYAEKRARLDTLLVEAIANPERFSDDAVYQETLDVYYTGRAIETQGPRLTQQLNELQLLLENSQVPIDVQLVSDNLTEVTLLRVSNLGIFQQTSVALKPGLYVAVGKRIGYREVREEFTVGFGQTPTAVTIQCVEPVVASNRRQ